MNENPYLSEDLACLDGHAAQDAEYDREHAVAEQNRLAVVGDLLVCEQCDETIVYGTTGWTHVLTPDRPHWAQPACTCERGDVRPDPRCRQHGHEDVRSGAYDVSPRVRTIVEAEIARMAD